MKSEGVKRVDLGANLMVVITGVLLAVMTLTASTCADDAVIRDRVVYETEINFMEKASLDQAEMLAGWIKGSCTCEGGKFSTAQCTKSAETVVAIQARIPWHKAMSRYNAGLDEERPPKDPPTIPEATTLCPEAKP